jgi:hypothetical protein
MEKEPRPVTTPLSGAARAMTVPDDKVETTMNLNGPGNSNDKSVVDPFDPAALRLDQSYVETAGVKKLLTTVPVRKPNRHEFVRVNPDPVYRLSPAAIIELKEDREIYLVVPHVAAQIPGEFVSATLYTAINRQGVLFVWPVKLPASVGKHNPWHRSAAEAAERAMKMWVRVTAKCLRRLRISPTHNGPICRYQKFSKSPSAIDWLTLSITR